MTLNPGGVTRQTEPHRWDGVDVMPYKEDGTHFKAISRQTLFAGSEDLPLELRYFEIAPGGHSTLERHLHSHVVVISRGSGNVLVRDKVLTISVNDVVHVPPLTWHQFQPGEGEILGFLCVVSSERDRPQRPTTEDLEMLRSSEEVAGFIKV